MRFPKMRLLLLFLVVELTVNAAIPSTTPVKPDCQRSCGDLLIPYPFGTSGDCCLDDSFLVTCNDSKPFLAGTNLTVLNISLDGELRVSTFIGQYECYNETGQISSESQLSGSGNLSKFYFSDTKNKITVTGCDTYAIAQSSPGSDFASGCMSLCKYPSDVVNGSCFGTGCCQSSIPKGIRYFYFSMGSYTDYRRVSSFNRCGFTFLAEEGSYIFSSEEITTVNGSIFTRNWPVVLDWTVGSETCEVAKKNVSNYACGENSICYESPNGRGYRCNCSQGYQGNRYLSNGCQDIDECLNELNNCTNICSNTVGSFNCSCPKGFHGDGVRGSEGCIRDQTNPPIWQITLGLAITVAFLVGCFLLYLGIRRRKLMQLREKYFQQNGGFMLQQQLSKLDSSTEATKIFTIEEVKKATNDFNESEIVGRGGFGTVYKGILPQNKVVAIKKSSVIDQSQVDQFINEVIILSQINHRNVVKLLGCCLETEVPLLVYEFITNGTLHHHLHEVLDHVPSIPWKLRLRIAKETAGALAYLHSAASMPIIHRDVKSTNILLDANFTAKVSDFGASRLVPLDKTQLTTLVQGTFGYLDPEYFFTSHLSDKSDTYSFGVVLAELLTGRKALCFDKPEEERSLATYFISSMQENRLSLILDNQIVNEDNANEIREVANIAQSCLRLKGDERPTMREVVMQLEGLKRVEKHLRTGIEVNPEETEFLPCE